jgi:hypothetical protein
MIIKYADNDIKENTRARHSGLTPVILATQKAEIRKTEVGSLPREKPIT